MRRVKLSRVLLIVGIAGGVVAVGMLLHKHYEPIDASVKYTPAPEEIVIIDDPAEPVELEELIDEEGMPSYKIVGEYRVTFYDAGPCCNGSNAGLDATGHPLVAGTVACNNFPLGTHVWMNLNGMMQEFVVRDRMASRYTGKNCIDVFVDTDHHTINELGVIYTDLMIQE